MTSISSASKTDRFVIHVPANPARVRSALYTLCPRPWVFIVQTNKDNPNYGYDIYISNEWGGYPDDSMFEQCKAFAENLVSVPLARPEQEVEKIPENPFFDPQENIPHHLVDQKKEEKEDEECPEKK